MMYNEQHFEQHQEKKEYSVEDGVQKSVSIILNLLKTQEGQKGVIVSITGSSFDVGKTFISGLIGKALSEKFIELKWCGDTSLLMFKGDFPRHGEVLILDAENAYTKDISVEQKANKFELPFSKIDLRIFVYHPDTPFTLKEKELADILIRHEGALNK